MAKRSTAWRTPMPCTPASSGTSLLVMYFSAASRCKCGAIQSVISHESNLIAGSAFGSQVHGKPQACFNKAHPQLLGFRVRNRRKDSLATESQCRLQRRVRGRDDMEKQRSVTFEACEWR